MNKQDREILRLTLMAFENNSLNVRNIRVRNLNCLSLDVAQSLLEIEQKMDDVKNAIMNLIIDQFPKENHLGLINEFEEDGFHRTNRSFLHDNVD